MESPSDDAYPEYGFIVWREIFNIYTVIHFDQQDPEASEDDQIAYYAESKPIQSRWKKNWIWTIKIFRTTCIIATSIPCFSLV